MSEEKSGTGGRDLPLAGVLCRLTGTQPHRASAATMARAMGWPRLRAAGRTGNVSEQRRTREAGTHVEPVERAHALLEADACIEERIPERLGSAMSEGARAERHTTTHDLAHDCLALSAVLVAGAVAGSGRAGSVVVRVGVLAV